MLPAPSLRSFLLLAQRFLVTAQLRCHPLLPSPSEEFLSLRHQLTFAASLFCLVSVTDTVRKQPSELTALPTRRGIAQALRQLAAALRLTCTLNTMAPQAQKEARSWAAPARAAMVREDAGHFVSLADWAQNPAQPGLAHGEEGLGRRWGGKNPVVEVSTSAHFRKSSKE